MPGAFNGMNLQVCEGGGSAWCNNVFDLYTGMFLNTFYKFIVILIYL